MVPFIDPNLPIKRKTKVFLFQLKPGHTDRSLLRSSFYGRIASVAGEISGRVLLSREDWEQVKLKSRQP